MELRDFIVTPITILLVYSGAYLIRPYVTDPVNRKYFFPGLSVRVLGAIALGFVYQFYYKEGDTFNYHTHGSRLIWEALVHSPYTGLKLFFADGEYTRDTYAYASQIYYFKDPASYVIIRIAAVFDLLTFSSYSATAVLFAVLAFSGSWAMFKAFYRLLPDFHLWIAFSCLFVPTVCFWGSSIFKDTITLAALGWATYSFYHVFIEKKSGLRNGLIMLVSSWVIFSVKKYILLVFLPAMVLWVFAEKFGQMKSTVAKALLLPFVLGFVLVCTFYTVQTITEDDPRYKITKLAETSKITAYDIRYGWGARTGQGSGYTLGELDGTWQTMLRLAPQAINVTLFRPYLWEVRNPLMLLSALESLLLLGITLYLLLRMRTRIFNYLAKPEILFCLSFALIFSFGVGVSTYNFGTLSRYKIPMMPFYLLALGFLYRYSKIERKLKAFDATE